MQEGVTSYSSPELCNFAASVNCLTHFASEYSCAEADSVYKKMLIAALIMNAAWFTYETKENIVQIMGWDRVLTEAEKQQNCSICFFDKVDTKLACGHLCCRGCLQGQIDVAFNNRGATRFDQIKCSDQNCKKFLSKRDIELIVEAGKKQKYLNAFDEAVCDAKKPVAENGLSDKEIRDRGYKRCPNPKCRVPIS